MTNTDNGSEPPFGDPVPRGACYRAVLEGILAQATQPVARIVLPVAVFQTLGGWNGTANARQEHIIVTPSGHIEIWFTGLPVALTINSQLSDFELARHARRIAELAPLLWFEFMTLNRCAELGCRN